MRVRRAAPSFEYDGMLSESMLRAGRNPDASFSVQKNIHYSVDVRCSLESIWTTVVKQGRQI